MLTLKGVCLFVALLTTLSAAKENITCLCGNTGRSFVTHVEPKVGSNSELCAMFQFCATCEDLSHHCATCPIGYNGPFCTLGTAVTSFDSSYSGNFTRSRLRRSSSCQTLAAPKFGIATCWKNPDEKICKGKCYPGYYFDQQDKNEVSLSCSKKGWTPRSSFPPCVSDGSCGMELHLPGDYICKTTARGRHCDITCRSSRPAKSRHLCVSGERWDPPLPPCARPKATPPKQRKRPVNTPTKHTVQSINCPNLLAPEIGGKSCFFGEHEKKCTAHCLNGYHFKEQNEKEIVLHCGQCKWNPKPTFPICVSEGICDIEMREPGHYNCTTDATRTTCDMACFVNKVEQGRYICDSKQGWLSRLPHCVGTKSPSQGALMEGCSDPGEVENAWKKVPESGYSVSSVVSYSCINNYEIVGSSKLTCRNDKTWSDDKPRCVPVGSSQPTACNLPFVPLNAQIEVWTESATGGYWSLVSEPLGSYSETAYKAIRQRQFTIGTLLRYRCRKRYYEPEGAQYQTCLESGHWNGVPSCKPVCGKSNVKRKPSIINGKPTEIGQWPWHIALYLWDTQTRSPSYSCGASLLAEKWVITAAHCITYKDTNRILPKRSVYLYAGKYFTNNTKEDSQQELKVKSIVLHEDYDYQILESDIALIELQSPVTLNVNVQPVCLPTIRSSEENIKEGNIGIIIGWGLDEFGKISAVLREGNTTIVSQRSCEQRYRSGRLSVNMFCARMDDDGSDSCTGDSGGPLMFQEPFTHKWMLEGIISFGSIEGCGLKQHYAAYVKVIKFVEWIRQKTQVSMK